MDENTKRRQNYPALGEDGLVAARRMIRQVARVAPSATLDETHARYVLLFDRAHASLVPLLGPLGTQAVVRRAIARATRRQPVLTNVVVTESRVMLDAVVSNGPATKELRAAADDLFCSTMDVVASLIGLDLLLPMLERLGETGTSRPGGHG